MADKQKQDRSCISYGESQAGRIAVLEARLRQSEGLTAEEKNWIREAIEELRKCQ